MSEQISNNTPASFDSKVQKVCMSVIIGGMIALILGLYIVSNTEVYSDMELSEEIISIDDIILVLQ